MSEDAPDPSTEAEDRRARHRLRGALAGGLGLLCLSAVTTIARELISHLMVVYEARQAAAAAHAAGVRGAMGGPMMTANVSLEPLLILEAIVVQPMFLVCGGFLIAFVTRSSYALSIGAFILYNIAAVTFAIFVWGLGVGWSPQHGLAAALVCLIGLPIAEFGLWTLFRPHEREHYSR